jgi:hypothetical protein
MKSIFKILVLSAIATGSAFASCPQVEGKYDYQCTVQKDSSADFAQALDVSGQMLVQQKGCDSYTFVNSKSQITEEFELLDTDDANGRSQAKIGKSDADVIKFKTIAHKRTAKNDLESLTASVTKGTIRKKKDGFTLKGKERSRVLGIFGKRHAKFTCRFTEQK